MPPESSANSSEQQRIAKEITALQEQEKEFARRSEAAEGVKKTYWADRAAAIRARVAKQQSKVEGLISHVCDSKCTHVH